MMKKTHLACQLVKLIAYFILKLKYMFSYIFHMVNIWPPKKCNLSANIFEDFSYGTEMS